MNGSQITGHILTHWFDYTTLFILASKHLPANFFALAYNLPLYLSTKRLGLRYSCSLAQGFESKDRNQRNSQICRSAWYREKMLKISERKITVHGIYFAKDRLLQSFLGMLYTLRIEASFMSMSRISLSTQGSIAIVYSVKYSVKSRL